MLLDINETSVYKIGPLQWMLVCTADADGLVL